MVLFWRRQKASTTFFTRRRLRLSSPWSGSSRISSSGILDKGTCQENEALFAAGELQETTVFKTFQSEDFHPEAALVHIFFLRLYIKTYGIHQAACYDADGWQVALVRAVKLRRYVADVFLDVPDAFAAASRIVEEGDVQA